MKIALNETTCPPCGVADRFARITIFGKIIVGIPLALLFQNPGEIRAQTLPPSYKVSLAWDASTSTDVTGYSVHYGSVSGNYTNTVVVGNVTSATVSGLASGITYYLAVRAISSSQLVSGFSNEASFLPGLQTTGLRITASGEVVLMMRGIIGSQYAIEASQDLKTWTVLDTVTAGDGGSMEFADPNAAGFTRRFYRTHKTP